MLPLLVSFECINVDSFSGVSDDVVVVVNADDGISGVFRISDDITADVISGDHIPGVLDIPGAPGVPGAPAVPDVPGVPDVTDVPDVPDVPGVPDNIRPNNPSNFNLFSLPEPTL